MTDESHGERERRYFSAKRKAQDDILRKIKDLDKNRSEQSVDADWQAIVRRIEDVRNLKHYLGHGRSGGEENATVQKDTWPVSEDEFAFIREFGSNVVGPFARLGMRKELQDSAREFLEKLRVLERQ